MIFPFHITKQTCPTYSNKHKNTPNERNSTFSHNTTMFRAMSTRKIHGGYEKLMEEEPILKKGTSVPASVYGNSRNPVQEEVKKTPTVKPTGGSVHPLLSFFDVRFQKKKKKTKKSLATAKPEFARYMAYVKEGGVWDPNSNAPVIHYR